jgi:hypothetical protein
MTFMRLLFQTHYKVISDNNRQPGICIPITLGFDNGSLAGLRPTITTDRVSIVMYQGLVSLGSALPILVLRRRSDWSSKREGQCKIMCLIWSRKEKRKTGEFVPNSKRFRETPITPSSL